MAKTPTFTVVIPCLNEEKYLPNLLEDLGSQSVKSFRVYVVDGNSDDDTVKKAKSFSNRLELEIITTSERNVSHQRNLGGKKAETEWLIFFDADNRLPADFFELIELRLQEFPCDAFTTYMEADTNSQQEKLIARTCNFLITSVAKINQPHAFGAMIGVTKQAFTAVSGFKEEIRFQEDSDFVERVAKSGYKFRVFKHPRIVYSFRRFRKEGMLITINKAATINFKNILKGQKLPGEQALYPMEGGSYYEPMPDSPQTEASRKQSKSR